MAETYRFRVDGDPKPQPKKRAPRSVKPDDGALVASYEATGNIWKTAASLGVSGQWVHGRLRRLGIDTSLNVFTESDRRLLQRDYLDYKKLGKLDELAKLMGRTKPFICRQARALGLTDRRAPKLFARKWKGMEESDARIIMDAFKASPLTMGRFCKVNGYGPVGFWQTMTRHFPDEWEHVIESKTPRTTKYRLGRAFEYRVRDVVRGAGYFVMRAPASRSPIDLLAFRTGVALFIQCKVSGALPPAEWNELFELATSVGGVPILAWRHGVRGLRMAVLTDRKDGSRRAQPMSEVTLEDVAGWRAASSPPISRLEEE